MDGVWEESTKKTDEYGYVEWVLEFDMIPIEPNAIDPTKEALLRFEMVDGFDEVIYPGSNFG